MIVYPKWELSPEGVARGWQYSRGVDYHVGNPTWMSYLFYYTKHPPHPDTQNPWQVETYKTHLGSAIPEQQVYRADHAGMSYSFIIPNNLSSQLGWDFTFFPKLRHSHMLFSTIR